MNDIFEPRSSSIINSFTSLDYELHLSINKKNSPPPTLVIILSISKTKTS